MSIQYSGGTLDNRSVVVGAACTTDLTATMSASLTAAGQTVTNLGQWNFLPDNNAGNVAAADTVTIDGRVYTFRAAVGATADEILIGVDLTASIRNLKAAINLETGSGTLYGSSTTLNASVTALLVCPGIRPTGFMTTVLVVYTKGGLAIPVSKSSAALNVWYGATLANNLYRAVSVETPAFQQITTYFGVPATSGAQDLAVIVPNRDGSAGSIGVVSTFPIANGQTWRVLAHKYGFHTFLSGSYGVCATGLYSQVPYIPVFMSPNKITAASNATPIQITTSVAHEYVTGDTVKILYVAGNTAANGTWTITVTGTTTFTLNTSVGNGVMTGTLGLVANQTPPRREVLEIAISNLGVLNNTDWRSGLVEYFQTELETAGVTRCSVYDGVTTSGSLAYAAAFPMVASPLSTNVNTLGKYIWSSGAGIALEPLIVFEVLYAAARSASAQLYNAFLVNESSPGGSAFSADSHTWFGVYNNDANGQLYLMTA